MSLVLHLSLHVFFALLAGLLMWLLGSEPKIAFVATFFGGVLIDLDHLIDYFIAFKTRFKLTYFLKGYQFLKNDKIYVLFHGWEYVILAAIPLLLFPLSIQSKWIIFGVALGVFFHLVADSFINPGMRMKSYSFLFRLLCNFEIQKIVTREHYKQHEEMKKLTLY